MATIMTDFLAQNGNNYRSDFELSTNNSELKSTYLGEFSPDFENFGVYEFRMDDIYPFLVFPAPSEHNIYVFFFYHFFVQKNGRIESARNSTFIN